MLSVFLTCASLSLESNCVGHSEVLAERGERGEEEYEKEEKDHSPRTSGQPVLSPRLHHNTNIIWVQIVIVRSISARVLSSPLAFGLLCGSSH